MGVIAPNFNKYGREEGYVKVAALCGVAVEEVKGDLPVRTVGWGVVPGHMGKFTDNTARRKVQMWRCLYWVFPTLRGLVRPGTVSTLWNGLTMDGEWGHLLGRCQIGFRHIQGETYKVVAFGELAELFVERLPKHNGIPTITFEYADGTSEEDKVSRELLAAHYAVGRILNLIGAGESIDFEGEQEHVLPWASNDRAVQRRWHRVLVAKLQGITGGFRDL
ncbi:hypothetical protein BJ508DRAFT_139655 [Ascobolus immersus RN42]|uniref:HNH nuclease domain-containing protein n=1 Tax=Ascobolus immersus RN42 TaxID=1160509 RepID=A0A3N4I6H0_ASCIM|nr:hypothetical protein BJ508DRAFT_139655 [Ascobolus immersus RN42]